MKRAIVFEGKEEVNLYRAIVIKHALLLYAKTGMKPNRAYTPTRMLQVATEYTGNHYKRGQHAIAAADMQLWIENEKQQAAFNG
jgi:hypothetical protein